MARSLPRGVRELEKGRLEKRFTVDGNRYSVYGYTVKELDSKELELRDLIRSGQYKKGRSKNDKVITLDDYFQRYLNHKKATTKGNSLRNYISIYNNHISKKIGHCRLRDITRDDIFDLQSEVLENTTASTANYAVTVIKLILNEAIEDKFIENNPAKIKSISIDKKKAKKTTHRSLSVQEQEIFMQAAEENFYYELFGLALSTGMRIGEIAALKWSDIDLKNNVIHITKTLTKDIDGKVVVGPPKSNAGIRDIPITSKAKEMIDLQKAKMETLLGISCSETKVISINSNYVSFKEHNVFYTPNMKIINTTVIDSNIDRIILSLDKKGNKMDRFGVHALRHTFATRCVESGMNPKVVQKLLGHERIEMTMEIYVDATPDTIQDEMQKLVVNF